MRTRTALLAVILSTLIAALATTGTLALFTAATQTQANSFTAGTVSLDEPSITWSEITDMAPGDTGSTTYAITYTGTLEAWVGLLPKVSGELYTCDGGRLILTLSDADDSSITYTWNGEEPLVIRSGPETATPLTEGTTKRFTVAWTLELGASNDCQEKSALVELMAVAVQAEHNTNDTNDGPVTWGLSSEPVPEPEPVLDQEYTDLDSSATVQGGIGQTFTVGRSGQLTKVALYLGHFFGPLGPGPVTVQIRSLDGSGRPSSTVLASSSLPIENIPQGGSMDWVEITLAAPIEVETGETYAIALPPSPNSAGVAWGAASLAGYPGGHGYWGYYLSVQAPFDLMFRTYVTPE